jgi:hypothetical protein
MKLRLPVLIVFLAVIVAVTLLSNAWAENLQVDLPYGIGTVQLPWQSTEILYGAMKPFKGGLVHQVAGASLPILTLGRLKSGYRIIDGSIGAIASIPNDGAIPDAYGALGHDIAQDIPVLNTYTSFHINGGVSYSNAAQGWVWGGTLSYALGGSVNTPGATTVTPPVTPAP